MNQSSGKRLRKKKISTKTNKKEEKKTLVRVQRLVPPSLIPSPHWRMWVLVLRIVIQIIFGIILIIALSAGTGSPTGQLIINDFIVLKQTLHLGKK